MTSKPSMSLSKTQRSMCAEAALVRQGTRVIFVTANPALVVGRVEGALGVLTKPADTGTLLDVVGWAALGGGQTPPAGLQPIAG